MIKIKGNKEIVSTIIVFLLHMLLLFVVVSHDELVLNAWKYTKMCAFASSTFILFVYVAYVKCFKLNIYVTPYVFVLSILLINIIQYGYDFSTMNIYIIGGILYMSLSNLYKENNMYICCAYLSFFILYLFLLIYILWHIFSHEFFVKSDMLANTTANSGILAILLGAVFIFVFEFTYSFPIPSKYMYLKKILILSLPFFILSVIALNNRTTILALIIVFIISRFNNIKARVFLVLLFVIAFIALYYVRPESFEGRLLVWQISLSMLIDHPILGIGIDHYRSIYPLYQLNFFSDIDICDRRNLLASNIGYAFNEPLQFVIENGIVGLIVIILLVYSFFNGITHITHINRSSYMTLLFLCISSCSYFTFHNIPIIIVAIICVAILTYSKFKKVLLSFYKLIFLSLSITVLICCINQYRVLQKLSNIGRFPIRKSIQLDLCNKYNIQHIPELMLMRIKILHSMGLYEETIKNIQDVFDFVRTDELYCLLSDCYYNIGDKDSANYYLQKAINLVPNNIENRYHLYLNYLLQKDTIRMEQCFDEICIIAAKLSKGREIEINNIINKISSDEFK